MYNRTLLAPCVSLAVFLTTGISYGQTPSIISVNDPRALAQAALQAEKATGIAINYEDVPYAYAGDIQDVAGAVMSPEQKAANPGAQIWVPRGGQITMDLSQVPGFAQPTALTSAGLQDTAVLVSGLIGVHARLNLPGVYQSSASNGALYITPTQVRSASGALVNASSPLDSKVTFPYQERTVGEIVDLILQQVSKTSGVQISVGEAPLNLILQTRTSLGASDEAARNVFGRMFFALASRPLADGARVSQLAYHLYFEPRLRYYLLNIHGVPQLNTPVAAQGTQPVPNAQANPFAQKK